MLTIRRALFCYGLMTSHQIIGFQDFARPGLSRVSKLKNCHVHFHYFVRPRRGGVTKMKTFHAHYPSSSFLLWPYDVTPHNWFSTFFPYTTLFRSKVEKLSCSFSVEPLFLRPLDYEFHYFVRPRRGGDTKMKTFHAHYPSSSFLLWPDDVTPNNWFSGFCQAGPEPCFKVEKLSCSFSLFCKAKTGRCYQDENVSCSLSVELFFAMAL